MSKPNRRHLTRRDFVRGTVGSALAAFVLGPSRLLSAQPSTEAGADSGDERSTVVVVREQSAMDEGHNVDVAALQTMLTVSVTGITGAATAREAWATLFRPDDVVGLVTTDFMNRTHPELVTLVTEGLVDAGVPEGNVLDAQGNDHKVKQCTALLCMPAMKAHWLTGIGTVIKNYIMFSGKPSAYHKQDSAKLGEIWLLPDVAGKTRLVLVDALRPMCNKGPQPDPRYKWDYRGLIASRDPVAADATCLRIIQAKRDAVRGEPWPLSPPPICVEAADTTYGLGTADPDRIDLQLVGWEHERLL